MVATNSSGTTQPGMSPACEGMLYTVFQRLRQSALEDRGNAAYGFAVAFTSANAGEGVTHTIEALVGGLARYSDAKSLVVSSASLRGLSTEAGQVRGLCRRLSSAAEAPIYKLEAGVNASGARASFWDSSWEYRRDVLEALRAEFDYVLVDCPALRTGNDVLSVAPFVDGVILVVEADRTRRDQVLNAEKSIEFARGRLLGHVLNKRRYVIPEWIYRRV